MTTEAATALDAAVPAAKTADAHSIAPDCLNCDTPLTGKYCGACGQRATRIEFTLHDFAHEAFHEFLHFDGKIIRTLKLLAFRPGELTKEFVEGKRARSISPVRIYLLTSVAFFALLAFVGSFEQSIVVGGENPAAKTAVTNNAPATQFEGFIEERARKVAAEKKPFAAEFIHTVPKVVFVLMPIFALLLHAFYFRRQRLFIPHLYFSIHFHAFMFLLLFAMLAVTSARIPFLSAAGGFMFPLSVPYFLAALRRTYGGSWGATIVKGVSIGGIYAVIVGTALVAVILVKLVMM